MAFHSRNERINYRAQQLLYQAARWVSWLSLMLLFFMLTSLWLNSIEESPPYMLTSYLLYGSQTLLAIGGLRLFSDHTPRPPPNSRADNGKNKLILFATLFGLSWTASIFHLAWLGNTFTNAEILADLIIMMALLGFFASKSATYIVIIPVLLASTYATLNQGDGSVLLPVQKLIATILIVFSGRRILYHWFISNVNKEHDKQLLIDQLDQLVTRDQLTGIHNRRFFEYELEKVFYISKRDNQPMALLIIDIDHFKQYNDTFGHPQGDTCLKQVATILEAALLRKSDSVSRYGGEEFIVILPNTAPDGALAVAHRIHQHIAMASIPHPASQTDAFVTVSIGYASMNDEKISAKLLERADLNLYTAKQRGRNQSVGEIQAEPRQYSHAL
ncbi:hypothetical protein ABT56_07625 [Photobacterium aquae]|uniref:diguanylate cyclase n=1 Tax=Photobacterium aquae TaxID=1195763 RepID=A0A0J1JXI6_9GAMM|nr:GGDEF domain-containing protein [Photobacterium aquae]KLV07007.1 hypothetical protein ABT56_07625 [Photobacterium aquae]